MESDEVNNKGMEIQFSLKPKADVIKVQKSGVLTEALLNQLGFSAKTEDINEIFRTVVVTSQPTSNNKASPSTNMIYSFFHYVLFCIFNYGSS